jgi:pSer/pThr/pTyr-binding forkhead associated (FHA) protein
MSDQGYAKLVGRTSTSDHDNVQLYISKLPCSVGRVGADICVPESESTVSREHAVFDFDGSDRYLFHLTCLSKNGMVVDGIKYEKSERAFLKSGSSIKLGSVRVYFLLAKEP